MTLTGCKTNDYGNAVIGKAIAQAPTILPDWPEYCSNNMTGVTPKLEEPVWGTQSRWNIVLSNENRRIDYCAKFYNLMKDNLAHAVVTN